MVEVEGRETKQWWWGAGNIYTGWECKVVEEGRGARRGETGNGGSAGKTWALLLLLQGPRGKSVVQGNGRTRWNR